MMRVRWYPALLLLAMGLVPGASASAQDEAPILVLTVRGPITPAMAEYLERGLEMADLQGAEALIFQMDTPGGQIEHMNRMVQAIRASDVPVIIYITPRGAIAGSAGTVITLAGHAAAMAPETAIGAASPVGGQGEDLNETIERKQKEILKAEVRGLAARRGEAAVALAQATIEEAKAVSADEALEAGLIDFVAQDLDDLIRKLDGFEVEMNGVGRRLATAGKPRIEIPQSFIEELLGALTNPNIVFLLMSVGVQSILIEISSPGGWVAGFIGVVCLALGAFGLGVLPVNWFGIIFVLTAFVLFILEVKAPTHGALTTAGVASFIAGALVLFNSPGTPDFFQVSVPLVVGTAVFTAALFFAVVTFAIRAQRLGVEVGAEALIGKRGFARTDLQPTGTVQIRGELWSAQSADQSLELKAGEEVEVVSVEGLRLMVRRSKEDLG